MSTTPIPIRSWKFTREEVAQCCLIYGPVLNTAGISDKMGRPLDAVLVMWAFALNESFHEGADILSCPPRFEPAYFTGGKYADPTNPACRYQIDLNRRFGQDGAKSYGNWQVMLCNTGFKPEEFAQCETGAQAFLSHTNRMIAAQKPKTLRDMADAYNSGNCRDRIVPVDYMDRLERNYNVPMPEIWSPR